MGEELAVLAIFGGAAGGEASAVDPHHHGQAAAGFLEWLGVGGRPDVESEAVLAGARIVEYHVGPRAGLEATRAEVACEEHVFPPAEGLRRTPAKFFDRRQCKRNAFVS